LPGRGTCLGAGEQAARPPTNRARENRPRRPHFGPGTKGVRRAWRWICCVGRGAVESTISPSGFTLVDPHGPDRLVGCRPGGGPPRPLGAEGRRPEQGRVTRKSRSYIPPHHGPPPRCGGSDLARLRSLRGNTTTTVSAGGQKNNQKARRSNPARPNPCALTPARTGPGSPEDWSVRTP